MIDQFRGDYRWLSNFWMAPVVDEGVTYPSTEHAFQAAKCADPADRQRFRTGTPGEAKRLGRQVALRADWEEIKVGVMRRVLGLKFAAGGDLAGRLLATGDEELVEGNTWGDTFWGVCGGRGENWLGRLLMERRAELRTEAGGDGTR